MTCGPQFGARWNHIGTAAEYSLSFYNGYDHLPLFGGELRVPTFNLVLPEISVVGNAVGTHDDLRELVALTAAGRVCLRTRTYPLDAFADAFADLENGRMHGRGVLVP